MALALTVPKIHGLIPKLNKKLQSQLKVGQHSMLMVGLTLTVQDVCMT